jgi:hypothetical protein
MNKNQFNTNKNPPKSVIIIVVLRFLFEKFLNVSNEVTKTDFLKIKLRTNKQAVAIKTRKNKISNEA